MFPAAGIQIYLKGTGCKAFSVHCPRLWNCLLLPQLNLCFNLHFKTHLCSLAFPSHGIGFFPYMSKAILCFSSFTHLSSFGQKLRCEREEERSRSTVHLLSYGSSLIYSEPQCPLQM